MGIFGEPLPGNAQLGTRSQGQRGDMVRHELSNEDRQYRADFEACRLPPGELDHRGHIRLAYIYLASSDTETALVSIRAALQAYLRHHGIDASKYHETITRAWILAVRHFMEVSPVCPSAGAFVEANPGVLDASLMMSHYSPVSRMSPN